MRTSLYTMLTVITGAVSLFLFGSEMFSLAVLLGLAWETLASLFVAPRVWFALAGDPGFKSSVESQ